MSDSNPSTPEIRIISLLAGVDAWPTGANRWSVLLGRGRRLFVLTSLDQWIAGHQPFFGRQLHFSGKCVQVSYHRGENNFGTRTSIGSRFSGHLLGFVIKNQLELTRMLKERRLTVHFIMHGLAIGSNTLSRRPQRNQDHGRKPLDMVTQSFRRPTIDFLVAVNSRQPWCRQKASLWNRVYLVT